MENKRNIRYVIITPAKNEEAYITYLLESVIKQSIEPSKWIIINDGSTDNTRKIIESYQREYNWIELVNVESSIVRSPGGEAVHSIGFEKIQIEDYDYIARLDGDISFEEDYFEELFKRFENDNRLGIGGGVCRIKIAGKLCIESSHCFHVRGPTKVYRSVCLKEIGPLYYGLGWDDIDELKAQMLGWKTKGFEELIVIHHRIQGTSFSLLRGAFFNHGKSDYFCGYQPLFVIAKAIRRLIAKPFIIGGVIYLLGFLGGYLFNYPRVEDENLVNFVKDQQLKKLLFKDSIWK